MLIDLEPQDALSVILGELAQFRVFLGIREKSFLQVGIVGINFIEFIVFVEVELGDLLLSCKQRCAVLAGK